MNFFNKIGDAVMTRLNDKFNPNSEHFAQGGMLGGQMGQPTQAPGIQSNMATAEQETRARQMGFRSAEEMALWQRNRNVQNGNNPTVGQPGVAGGQVAPPSGPMAGHPANVFQYITNVLKNAVGGR